MSHHEGFSAYEMLKSENTELRRRCEHLEGVTKTLAKDRDAHKQEWLMYLGANQDLAKQLSDADDLIKALESQIKDITAEDACAR